MDEKEIYYAMALTRISWFNTQATLQLYRRLGSAQAIYEQRNDIADIVENCPQRLAEAIKHWDEPLRRAAAEMEFVQAHGIQVLAWSTDAYPQRLRECPDAPTVLYYKGTAELNQAKVINIVGTRHCTPYGQDVIQQLTRRLSQLCPQVLIVSGLAYGVDINAHRQALENGFETVGVLAHGLDYLYPPRHRDTAREMTKKGGLLTEFMTQTNADKANFVRRNRIVAGMCDATILVESAARGGGLITAEIAMGYNRAVFAIPGSVGAPYSEGCNNLIRDNGAALITSADDLVKAMGWASDALLKRAQTDGIERNLFPDLSPEEQSIVDLLQKTNDLQLNIISVKTNLPISQASALLFQLEMKGVLKPLAGGMYHLLK
jgi:DNA processing protein